MKDQAKIIAALLVGAAAGAALGILLAPDSGEVTRNDISDYINDAVSKAKEKTQSATDNIKEYGNNLADKVRSKYSDAANDLYSYRDGVSDEIRLKGEELDEAAQDHVRNAKSKVKSVANDVNDSIQQA